MSKATYFPDHTFGPRVNPNTIKTKYMSPNHNHKKSSKLNSLCKVNAQIKLYLDCRSTIRETQGSHKQKILGQKKFVWTKIT
jgi:hypothetical protein